MKARGGMLDMKVSRLTVDPFTNTPIIILRDEAGTEALPIWIGLIEASAIASELENIALDRPMTHDLMKNIIGECGVKVDRIEVHDVRDNTFYATIHLVGRGAKQQKKKMAIDARPSDAIALALRTGARICVSRKVLERTQNRSLAGDGATPPDDFPKGELPPDLGEAARLMELLENLSDEEFGKWKM
jgi:bifunctional DNase/RNase